MSLVHLVLANAAQLDWQIHHIDIKSAYLNADLKETIDMKPPRGVLKPGKKQKVCCLLKGLYGLKQAGRGWYKEMSSDLINDLKFKWSAVDHSVFYQWNQVEHTVIVIATEGMAIISKQIEDVKKFKQDIIIGKSWTMVKSNGSSALR